MCTLEQFRHKLARRLREEAGRRWHRCAGDPSGADLKVMALCERLADEAEHLAAADWQRIHRLGGDAVALHHFEEVWEAWPEALGVTLWPSHIADLMGWISDHAERDAVAQPSRRLRVAATGRPSAGTVMRRSPDNRGWGTAFATDFTAGLGIVAPALAAWEASVGLAQWRDMRLAAGHPSVTATVLAVTTDRTSRDIRPASSATLSFVPAPGEPACHVAVPFGPGMGSGMAGTTLAVVPRSVDCAAPLLLDGIGDPLLSGALAAGFLAAGLVSLKAWSWLTRRGRRRQPELPTLVRSLPLAL